METDDPRRLRNGREFHKGNIFKEEGRVKGNQHRMVKYPRTSNSGELFLPQGLKE